MLVIFILRASFLALRRLLFHIAVGIVIIIIIPILRSIDCCRKEYISCGNQAYFVFRFHVLEILIFHGTLQGMT